MSRMFLLALLATGCLPPDSGQPCDHESERTCNENGWELVCAPYKSNLLWARTGRVCGAVKT